MPSATAALPKRCARSMAVWQIAALVASVAQSRTKLWSSLSSTNGSSRRLDSEEIARAEIVDRDLDPAHPQPARDLLREPEVAHDLVLGDLDDDARPAVGLRPVLARPVPQSAASSSTLTGTLMARCRLKPASSNFDQLRSVAISACSVSRAMLSSLTPCRKLPGSSTPCSGWRMRASASAPARHLRLRSILG